MDALTVTVDAMRALLRIERMPENVRRAIRGEVFALTKKLAGEVRTNLLGRVLNKRSGALLDSIRDEARETPLTVDGRVFVDPGSPAARYARIHEYGGKTKPHQIVAKNAQALAFEWKGQLRFFHSVNHPGSNIPERSYLRSALAMMTDEIVTRLTRAAQQSAKAA